MSWLPGNEEREDNKYLRIDNPSDRIGDSVEVVVRVLDEKPVRVFKHWIGNRPLVCPGSRSCPACFARKRAEEAGDPKWKELYRFDGKYLINVAVGTGELGPENVKIWAFGRKVGDRIALLADSEEYGDPREYDLRIFKRRIAYGKLGVEYDLLPKAKSKDGFGAKYQSLLEHRHDLQVEIEPATVEDYKEAFKLLEQPQNGEVYGGNATILQTAELQRLAESKGYTLEQLNIDTKNLSSQEAEKYIADLKA